MVETKAESTTALALFSERRTQINRATDRMRKPPFKRAPAPKAFAAMFLERPTAKKTMTPSHAAMPIFFKPLPSKDLKKRKI